MNLLDWELLLPSKIIWYARSVAEMGFAGKPSTKQREDQHVKTDDLDLLLTAVIASYTR